MNPLVALLGSSALPDAVCLASQAFEAAGQPFAALLDAASESAEPLESAPSALAADELSPVGALLASLGF